MTVTLVCTIEGCQQTHEVDVTEAHEYSPYICADHALEDALNQIKPITVFPKFEAVEDMAVDLGRGRF